MTLESFNDDDIIEAEGFQSKFFQLDSLKRIVEGQINGSYKFGKGIKCRVLKPGRQWQEGTIKVKYTIEFHPNQPEPVSELDDIRNMPIQE